MVINKLFILHFFLIFSKERWADVLCIIFSEYVASHKQHIFELNWAIPWGLMQGRCGPLSDFIFDVLSGKSVCISVGFEVFSSHIPTVADI